jgi:hypothetical protein
MHKLKRLFKRERGTWALAVLTLAIGGLSLWSSNLLYQRRGDQPSNPSAVGNCTLSYSIPTPIPCSNIHIVGMTLDRSSSMNALETDGRTKLAWAKEAANTFLNTIRSSGTTTVSVAINSFGAQGNDGTGTLGSTYNSLLHQGLTNNIDSAITALGNVRYITSGTCIMCGIRLSNSQVNTASTAKKVAILLSDGRANRIWNGTQPGSAISKQAAIDEANRGRAMGVQYHVIGYGSLDNAADETTLRAIAGSNGSYQFKPNAQEWSTAMLNIMNNICSSPNSTRTPTTTVLAPLNLVATEDTHVRSDSTSTTYGSFTTLNVDYNPTYTAYMKFDLTSLGSRTVNKATLRVRVTNAGGTQNLKSVTSTTWNEATMTYSNRPALGSVVATISNTVVGSYKEIDITTFVQNNKGRVVSLAVDTTNTDGFNFYSSEYGTAAYRPTIIAQ